MANTKLNGYEKPSLDQYTRADLVQICANYMIGGRTSGFSKLSKTQLIAKILNDADYIKSDPNNKYSKKLKKQVGSFLTRGRAKLQNSITSNRISPIVASLFGNETPDDLMDDIIQVLSGSESKMVVPGKYYTFIYRAVTSNLNYDSHPLIKVGEITRVGFKAFNYHWKQVRQYGWEEVMGTTFYEVSVGEYTLLQQIPYQKFSFVS